jgi:hypothetical protein
MKTKKNVVKKNVVIEISTADRIATFENFMVKASSALNDAVDQLIKIENCPLAIRMRINNLSGSVITSRKNAIKQVSGIGRKAEKAAAKLGREKAATEKKANKLIKMKARAEALNAKIAKLSS